VLRVLLDPDLSLDGVPYLLDADAAGEFHISMRIQKRDSDVADKVSVDRSPAT
jgi:hypothetical protein